MDTTPNAAWIESHTDYLRRLARALLRDSDGAEDAVQETWLKASQAGPVAEGSRRAWLGTVLRNVVRQNWRTAARRSRREQRATRRQEAPSTVHEVARLEQAEHLLDALRAMAVEKRHVLEMRYFEGLPPRHIAERLGIPVDTVKTRLRRGLAELRTRLGAEESRDWKQRLALALGLPLGLPWRSVVLPVACGLALVVGATLWSGVFSPPEAPETKSTSTSLAGEATTTLEAAPAARPPVLHGQVAAAAPPAARPPVAGGGAGAAPQAAKVALEVTLVDAAGRPLPPPTGVLHAVLGKNDSGRLVELPVHEGRALVELPPGVRPAFQALAREGGAARVLHPTTHASWEPCESCIVACQLVPPTRLRVLDGETLRDVSELHVLRCTSRIGSSLPRPPEDEVDLSSSVSSPTWLPADADGVKELTAPWRVWAPGYAWRRFEIRAGVDLEQVVHVEPGGRVRVRLEGPRLKVPAQLTVTHVEPGNSSTTTALDVRGPGVHDIEGVPTGPCRLRVQLGDWWDTDRVLGEVTTEIRRGDVSEVTLRYGGTEPPPSVPLAGSLHLPAAWPR
ncbi:MAG: RNA polymerase sigma factor, partial [Myxococcales bacterium]|nr:RNA polymerase sigma factor [Myxococcales bacterium]